ncbi:MAG: endonuclease/exonuclease/phosphatase family protein [Bacteroides sp.]|nr:endonuclease/exonuclease/phosphatase family protein [Bacteroides sp.]MCM1085911.1 endonuclease/exonuclease/phosphatase family protein [Bacteroides sp.]
MKQKAALLILLVFLGLSVCVQAQEKKQYRLGMVGFYNLENLFDTIDDPLTNDKEFLPNGSYGWTGMKYRNKLHNLAVAISSIHQEVGGAMLQVPDILGVSEIENRKVLEDLVAQPELAPYDFGIVHYDGPDRRGVDVGLLYKKDKFTVLGSRSVNIPFERMEFYTRDQLVVSGIYMGDTIHFIVIHWPSRLGGEKKSSPKRELAAEYSRGIVDSLLAVNPKAKVVLMGDMNDDPYNNSVVKIMNAPKQDDYTKLQPGQMFNASYGLFKRGVGTLCYQGKWNLFDQMIITQGLTGKDRSTLKFYGYRIFNDPMLIQKSGKYNGYPLRTHAGGVYLNGYSDHFPVYMILIKEK